MAQPNRQYLSIEEYLWEEQHSETKRDYYNGQVYNMAGGTVAHSRIAVNVINRLSETLEPRGCQVFNSDLKVAVAGKSRQRGKRRESEDEFVTYPDVSVVCGEVQLYQEDAQTLANPVMLVEVLSPSTRNYDRTVKLEQYRKLPSLQAYLMVDSEWVWAELYLRLDAGNWQVLPTLVNLEETLNIEALGIELTLAALYRGVQLNEVDPA
ncbi:MAG TPA: Uma2 family endonuclease [Chloroflexia bacterium]|nr:Uma2 family endonuclease [Chloroflexia bacterium]